jgi:hypothetical protein
LKRKNRDLEKENEALKTMRKDMDSDVQKPPHHKKRRYEVKKKDTEKDTRRKRKHKKIPEAHVGGGLCCAEKVFSRLGKHLEAFATFPVTWIKTVASTSLSYSGLLRKVSNKAKRGKKAKKKAESSKNKGKESSEEEESEAFGAWYLLKSSSFLESL